LEKIFTTELGISRQTLVNYQNGQVPTFATEKLSRQLKAIANKSKLDIKEIIGNRLQELRGSTALNDISEKLNMSTNKYIALENGKAEVDVNHIIAIIDHYQISADYLFGREATSQTQNQTQSIEQSSTPSADTTSNSTD